MIGGCAEFKFEFSSLSLEFEFKLAVTRQLEMEWDASIRAGWCAVFAREPDSPQLRVEHSKIILDKYPRIGIM